MEDRGYLTTTLPYSFDAEMPYTFGVSASFLIVPSDTLAPLWNNPADSLLRFDDELLLFGEAEEGDEVLADYIFTNIGRIPLEIDLVSACDCIKVDWPRGEIAPGEAARIETVFNTAGRPGETEKTIDVIFKNTDKQGYPLVKQVKLKGKVLVKK